VDSSGLVAALREALDVSRVQADVQLSAFTTLRVGGPAAALAHAEQPRDLEAIAKIAHEFACGWLVIGKGSNLLIADTGWPGIAVVLGRGFRGVEVDGAQVRAGAAEPMPALAQHVAREGLAGLAFGVAIPGTVGGAVRMNAGAHGGELAQVLQWAEVARMSADGALERWDRERLGFGYRHSELGADAIVTRVQLRLRPADAATIAAAMADMRQWRREHQPINEPSCGSVFRNPPGDSAGRLIEAAGLKGLRIGGAQISRRHANFITAGRDARAHDVYRLIRTAQHRVLQTAGVELETEVVLAGFSGSFAGSTREASSLAQKTAAAPDGPSASPREANPLEAER
jgi:UDP-N-acetylmuramate dehydrogenase